MTNEDTPDDWKEKKDFYNSAMKTAAFLFTKAYLAYEHALTTDDPKYSNDRVFHVRAAKNIMNIELNNFKVSERQYAEHMTKR